MSWDDVKKGSGKFVLLKDGDCVVGTPLGAPVKRLNKFGGKRYYMNFLIDGEEKCAILPMSVTVADELKTQLQAADPKKSLVGRVAVKLSRTGAGQRDTKYTITMVKLTPAQIKAVAKAEQIDLEEADLGEEAE